MHMNTRKQLQRQRFPHGQDALKHDYGDHMSQLQNDFKDLENNPRAKSIFELLDRRMGLWMQDSKERHSDLAWARSELEALRKATSQQSSLDAARDALRDTSHSLEQDPAAPFHPFILPIDTVDPYLQVPIDIPASVGGTNGKPHRVLLQPNGLQQLWGKNDGKNLREAGIWIEKDIRNNGKVRGLKIHFTKEGLYTVKGTPWPVGSKATENAAALRAEREKSVIHKLDFSIPKGVSRIRVLRLPKRTQVDLPIPRSDGTVDVGMGVSLIRATEDGKPILHLTFCEPGKYQVLGVNPAMERATILHKSIHVEKPA